MNSREREYRVHRTARFVAIAALWLYACGAQAQIESTMTGIRSLLLNNTRAVVTMTAPAPNATVGTPGNVTVSATASDADGAVTKVEFYAGAALIGTVTTPPYTTTWAPAAAGSYSLTARATDNRGESTVSPAVGVSVVANAAPTVVLTSPGNNSNYAAAANVTLTASAADSDGTISKVEFYVNGALAHTDTAGPFSFTLTNLQPGTYAITAKAIDQFNLGTMSAPITITVGAAAVYYIHTDHLNSPRVITNGTGQAVWTWANDDPFGYNAPIENPSGLGNFTCNLRFPGQYFDKELNTHYNYFRDYDPTIGRYIQSDPIGLKGGINTYAYVGSSPVNAIDPAGLAFDSPATRRGKDRERPPNYSPQDRECNMFGMGYAADRDKCIKKCCVEHDNCYTRYKCDAWSWWPSRGWTDCMQCNIEAGTCLARALTRPRQNVCGECD